MSDRTLRDILEAGRLEVVIDDYGFTGEGYVELADGWLSVPGALPGERVRVEVEEGDEDARRLFAQPVEILEASDQRRDPLCERDAVCRGCHLRHATIPEELRFKKRTVREVVEKFAEIPVDEQPEVETVTPRPIRRGDAHRIRSTLTYRDGDGDVELGLVTPVEDRLVPMGECPALTGSTRRLISHVEGALEATPDPPPAFRRAGENGGEARPGIAHIGVATPTFGRGLVDLAFDGLDEDGFVEMLHAETTEAFVDALLERLPEDVGLSAHRGEVREEIKPPNRITLPLLDLKIVAGYDDWFPATLRPTEVLYETALAALELGSSDRFLDVGCGVGTLSILAGPHVDSATGIDINRHSIEAAELNAIQNDVDNVEFMPSGWEKALRQLALGGRSYTAATINPMRSPLGERPLTYLGELGVERLVYLGPSAESAAKDIGVLVAKGWSLEQLGAANIHPATYHTMLVAKLARTG